MPLTLIWSVGLLLRLLKFHNLLRPRLVVRKLVVGHLHNPRCIENKVKTNKRVPRVIWPSSKPGIAVTNWLNSNLVVLCIHNNLQVWECFKLVFQEFTAEIMCTQACLTHTRCISGTKPNWSQHVEQNQMIWPIYNIALKSKIWLVHRCFSLFQCSFGPWEMFLGTQALSRNRRAYVDTQN